MPRLDCLPTTRRPREPRRIAGHSPASTSASRFQSSPSSHRRSAGPPRLVKWMCTGRSRESRTRALPLARPNWPRSCQPRGFCTPASAGSCPPLFEHWGSSPRIMSKVTTTIATPGLAMLGPSAEGVRVYAKQTTRVPGRSRTAMAAGTAGGARRRVWLSLAVRFLRHGRRPPGASRPATGPTPDGRDGLGKGSGKACCAQLARDHAGPYDGPRPTCRSVPSRWRW